MFAFELSTLKPCGSAPYYSLVIRDPYIIGSHPGADIAIAYDGISTQHVSLTVLHAQEAEREVEEATRRSAGRVATAPRSEDSADEQRYEEEEEGEGAHNAAAVRKPAARAEDAPAGEHDGDGDEEEEEEEEKAAHAQQGEDEADAVRAPASSGARLAVRVTALPTKGDADVRIGNVSLHPGDSVVARDGDVLSLGDGVSGTFRYRPLMVGLEVGTYPEDYVNDLRRMFDQLGATFVEEPIPSSEVPHVPIGQLYCAEELNDSTNCLAAMAYGYSVVQPTYVFEWFAAVSRKASAPLSTLPSPTRFEVPVRCTTHPTTTTYLRPESDTCPFSLFPIPSTAMTNRSRAELFAGRVFFFFTDAAATRYWRAVEDCGGAVYGPGDVDAAKEAIHRLVEAQLDAGMPAHRLPSNFYIIIDNTSEAVLLNSGLEAASPELLAFMNEAGHAYGATNLCVMGDHSLFTALLSNRFCEEPVPLTSGVPVAVAAGANDPAYAFGVPPLSAPAGYGEEEQANAALASARTPRSTYSPRYHGASGQGSARSASRMSTREHDRRNSLLPRTENRTPSRSQMRSFSRQRAHSASMRSANQDGTNNDSASYYEGASYNGGSTSGRRGRRHLVPSVIEGELRSFAEDFDMVRVRIYAFLVREEPRLDKAIATYHRNLYVTIDSMEYALEIKAQAEDFMERVDDLLADPACHGAYTESLRRFWRDCSDMDVKAQHLLHCWDRRFPAAALPRRSHSRRANSAASRRAPSSRSMTPRGAAASQATSPAPARQEMGSPDQHHPRGGATASQPRNTEGSREHRELYMSPGAAQRLQETDAVAEEPFTSDEALAATGVQPPQPTSSRARGHSASSRQSRRRSSTPRAKTSHTVPVDQRPPWVDNWAGVEAEKEEKEKKRKERPSPAKPPASAVMDERPASEAYRPAPHTTPARKTQEEKTPRAPQQSAAPAAEEVAEHAPHSVRARSAKGQRQAPPSPQQHLHETVLSEGSVRFTVEEEEDDGIRSPVECAESHPHPYPHPQESHEDEDTHDATEGTVDFAVDEEPSTHAAAVAGADDTEVEDEGESEVRTAPVPTPPPAPAAKARKAATPTARRPRAASASATKRTAETNGSAANGRQDGQSRRKSSTTDAPAKKPLALPAWKY